METMKTLIIKNKEAAEMAEVPKPKPAAGQALIKVRAVTTCPQWDLHIYHGRPMFEHHGPVPFPYMPGQPGHEMTGVVDEVGEGVSLKIGETVCAWRDPGQGNPGCYAEYVLMNEADLLPVPERLHYTQVVSLELAMCIASSILRLRETVGIVGKRCAVNGLGPAGIVALQMLRAEGADTVIGIDPLEARRELALELGASEVYGANSDALTPRGEDGAIDVSIDCVGYPSAVRYLMDHTQEAVALFAVQRDDYVLRHDGLSVIGYPGHYRAAAEYALGLIEGGKLDLRPLITCEMPLASYGEAVAMLRSQEAIKICLIP
ncbi:oxidoreductase zinc-binding dehydrogenase family [Paenibacillus agaridevorans]|uniref:Oxidoreductase zinc-binding dehydrogenase family n=1 Tax=Paenibacillus agaridevorans TaxID=171404 RepID=A0A2R5EX00_9BACL|nr:zinc-binding dehydrogenase [Paenibacillus agaridevorans]GBG10179.1 oxidoreductase zinc-binding dehydrogenase family [Paenibacillus agaridevorans]